MSFLLSTGNQGQNMEPNRLSHIYIEVEYEYCAAIGFLKIFLVYKDFRKLYSGNTIIACNIWNSCSVK